MRLASLQPLCTLTAQVLSCPQVLEYLPGHVPVGWGSTAG